MLLRGFSKVIQQKSNSVFKAAVWIPHMAVELPVNRNQVQRAM